MMSIYSCLLLTTMLIYSVSCYPNGVGVDVACLDLTPRHGVSPRNDKAPYYIELSASTVSPGSNVTVTLYANGTDFKGFMIQARRAGSSSEEQLGLFVDTLQTTLACSDRALVHSNSGTKNSIQFIWTAPSTLDSNVIFNATVVEKKDTFWRNVTSSILVLNNSTTTSDDPEYDDCFCFTRNTKACNNDTKVCECRDGWSGTNCTDDVDECSEVQNPCGDNVTCINLVGAYRCQCENATWLNSSGQCEEIPVIKCHALADIFLVIDSSGSIGSANFQIVRSFLETLLVFLHVSSPDIRVGVIEFARNVKFVFGLNSYATIEERREAIQNMEYIGAGTRTDLALNYIIEKNLYSEEAGGRPEAPDIVVTMTDGQSNVPAATKIAAEKMKKAGFKMVSVGITKGVDMEELKTLASSEESILLVDNFKSLANFLKPLINKTCEAIKVGVDSIPASLGVCKGANFTNGVANLPYPGDCTQVVQCYYNKDSKTTLAVIRKCSPGEFWSQEKNDCVSSWTVQSPYDKCKNGSQTESFWDCSLLQQDDVVTYAMPGARRGYYRCKNGRSYPECCPWKSEYVQGLGCQKNPDAVEKCGPQKSCAATFGVCHKLPVWKNPRSYLDHGQVVLSNQVSCAYGDFSILDCNCEVKTLNDYYQTIQGCPLIFEADGATECRDERYIAPASACERDANSKATIKLWLNLQTPHFEITASPNTTAQDSYGLKLWGDMETISVAIGRRGCKDQSQTSVLWKNATGVLEVSILFQEGRMTLAVAQGNYTIVSAVEAKQSSKYVTFQYEQLLKAKCGVSDTCIISKVQVYDCLQRFNTIYNNSNK